MMEYRKLLVGDMNKVVASLLARAYAAEYFEANLLSEALLYVHDDEVWNDVFSLIKDNELHRTIIEEIVEVLGFDIKDFREYSKMFTECKINFSGDFLSEMFSEILNYEIWAEKFYKHLAKLVSAVPLDVEKEKVEIVKNTLEMLSEWERKHTEVARKYIQ